MVFSDLITKVEKHLRFEDPPTEISTQIKTSINEAILDFVRYQIWNRATKVYDFTTDDSGSYTLPSDFEGELALYDDDGALFAKKSYKLYLPSKFGNWAVLGSNMYIDGDGKDLHLEYTTRGDPYPLTDAAHESEITANYPYMIIQWAVVNFLHWYNDEESVKKEEGRLTYKLKNLHDSEQRHQKKGKNIRLASHNR